MAMGSGDRSTREDKALGQNTMLQAVKQRLNMAVSHFRDDHYCLGWAYQEIEAIRIFWNSQRIIHGHDRQAQDHRMPATDLLQQSLYGSWSIVNEKLTTVVPRFIRTGDAYITENERKIKAMLSAFGIPTLFVTVTFSERWPRYEDILASRLQSGALLFDCPWEAVQYYHERFHWLKKSFFRNIKYSGFKELREMVERHEFQLRDTIHTHSLLWTESTINELIDQVYIRADVPDPEKEPRLYELVQQYQIYTCSWYLCGGTQPPHGTCRKGFSAPFASRTFRNGNELRWTYRRIVEADRWISPYCSQLLLLWEGHINVQYCTKGGLASYISKYVSKSEPKSLVNINNKDFVTSHLLGRRMGSMEVIMLLESFPIFQMSSGSIYLPTTTPNMRASTVKPVHMLEEDPESPYFPDALEKSFVRPQVPYLDSCTYFEYYKRFQISKSRLRGRQGSPERDRNGYFVYQCKKELLIRGNYRRLCDGESFFYFKV